MASSLSRAALPQIVVSRLFGLAALSQWPSAAPVLTRRLPHDGEPCRSQS